MLFFRPACGAPAVRLPAIGYILFAMKPTIRLVREVRLAMMGGDGTLADRD